MKTMRRRLNLFKQNSTRFNWQIIYSKEIGDRAFFVAASRAWNTLPSSVTV